MKSLYTNKQRRAIYFLAANLIEQGAETFCCRALEKVFGFHVDDTSLSKFIKNNLPEFEMFNPNPEEIGMSVWFSFHCFSELNGIGTYTPRQLRNQRLFCLLSCAEIIRLKIPIA